MIDWTAAASKAGPGGLQLLLMGSATKLAAPQQKTVFLEDLAPAELAKVKEPSGLVNLGEIANLFFLFGRVRRRIVDRTGGGCQPLARTFFHSF
jgi:hypothetical protein